MTASGAAGNRRNGGALGVTPEEFDAFLTVAKRHGVTIHRIGDIVLGGQLAGQGVSPVEPGAPTLELPAPKTAVEAWDQVDKHLWPEGLPT